MLCALTLLTFFVFFSASVLGDCGAHLHAEKAKACSVSPLNKSVLEEVSSLQQDSTKKTEKLLNDKDFQEFVAQIDSQGSEYQDPGNRNQEPGLSSELSPFQTPVSKYQIPDIYIFVSFSLGEKALLQLAKEAKFYGATLVLRGFKDGSYVKTAQALQKIIQKTGHGFLIDPELFSLFKIKATPTFILAKPFFLYAAERKQTPLHDRLQGHVSLTYAIEVFSQGGDLASEAKTLLQQEKARRGKTRTGEEK